MLRHIRTQTHHNQQNVVLRAAPTVGKERAGVTIAMSRKLNTPLVHTQIYAILNLISSVRIEQLRFDTNRMVDEI